MQFYIFPKWEFRRFQLCRRNKKNIFNNFTLLASCMGKNSIVTQTATVDVSRTEISWHRLKNFCHVIESQFDVLYIFFGVDFEALRH